MIDMWRVLLSLWTWFEIALCATVGFFIQLALWLVTRPFDRRRVVAGRCFRLVGVTAARLTPCWRFGVYGDVPRRFDGRTVFVSNHEFASDPFLISFLPWEMKWLGKASLFKDSLRGLEHGAGGRHPYPSRQGALHQGCNGALQALD